MKKTTFGDGYDGVQIYDFQKDVDRLKAAIDDEVCAARFTDDQLMQLAKFSVEHARIILFNKNTLGRLTAEHLIALIHHSENHAKLIFNASDLSNRLSQEQLIDLARKNIRHAECLFSNRMILDRFPVEHVLAIVTTLKNNRLSDLVVDKFDNEMVFQIIADRNLSCFSADKQLVMLNSLLMRMELWDKFTEIHWQAIFSTSISVDLMKEKNSKIGFIYSLPNLALEILFACLRTKRVEEIFISDVKLCEKLPSHSFFKAPGYGYSNKYLELIIAADHIIDRLNSAEKLALFDLVLNTPSAEKLLSKLDQDHLPSSARVVEERMLTKRALDCYTRYERSPHFIVSPQDQITLVGLDIHSKISLSLINRSCFELFYLTNKEELLGYANKVQIIQLMQLHPEIARDFPAMQQQNFKDRAWKIKQQIEAWPRESIERKIEIAVLTATANEEVAFILIQNGYWREAADPNAMLIKLSQFAKVDQLIKDQRLWSVMPVQNVNNNNNEIALAKTVSSAPLRSFYLYLSQPLVSLRDLLLGGYIVEPYLSFTASPTLESAIERFVSFMMADFSRQKRLLNLDALKEAEVNIVIFECPYGTTLRLRQHNIDKIIKIHFYHGARLHHLDDLLPELRFAKQQSEMAFAMYGDKADAQSLLTLNDCSDRCQRLAKLIDHRFLVESFTQQDLYSVFEPTKLEPIQPVPVPAVRPPLSRPVVPPSQPKRQGWFSKFNPSAREEEVAKPIARIASPAAVPAQVSAAPSAPELGTIESYLITQLGNLCRTYCDNKVLLKNRYHNEATNARELLIELNRCGAETIAQIADFKGGVLNLMLHKLSEYQQDAEFKRCITSFKQQHASSLESGVVLPAELCQNLSQAINFADKSFNAKVICEFIVTQYRIHNPALQSNLGWFSTAF